MINLEKGAKVKVRLHTGEVVEAEYSCQNIFHARHHFVVLGGLILALASGETPRECDTNNWQTVRFVGPSCVLGTAGVRV